MFTVVSTYLITFKNSMISGTANLPEYLSSPPVFYGFRVAKSLFFCLVFCISLFVPFFILAIVLSCPASIYGFLLPLWYLKFRPFLGLSNWPLINVREEGLH